MDSEKKSFKTRTTQEVIVLDYLAKRFTYLDRDQWIQRIKLGDVQINGSPISISQRALANTEIEFYIQESEAIEPIINSNWKLLYEDDFLFIVDKPPDLPIHPAGRYRENTLLSLLEKSYPNIQFHPCHRLDRETSGIVIFAKDSKSSKKISDQFIKSSIHKEYRTFVYGDFPEFLQVDGWISKDIESVIRKKKRLEKNYSSNKHSENSQFASTYFEKVSIKNNISYIAAFPKTGRTHQIRASLYSCGYPLLGDKIYGRDEASFLKFIESGWSDELNEVLGHNRQALHCYKMQFIHPDNNEYMEIISKLPSDLLPYI
ncbi:RluA family pseudouridine synthase [Leptospira sp. GIMC2001]|uniref:RluA family pseudouridine synthase n=1 Tax=Leptospira sp. GIMC2001 TaxID=1513297 RepID=UPI00234B03A6|nr:RluA family pseudouridine synthase [Leptospira sp. GIMC2001]WCL48283.1 RluA family pseudouridine synthase [Leptospira sp. GIMC2001]